jgi:hypothetical protein
MSRSSDCLDRPARTAATTAILAREEFLRAATRSGLAPATAEALWLELVGVPERGVEPGAGLRRDAAPFARATRLSRSVRVLLYVGAVLVVGSCGWWGYDLHVGVTGLLALSLAYAAGFLAAGLWARARALDELAAAAALIVAFYVPVVVFASLRVADVGFRDQGVSAFYEWISGGWIWLELAAIAGAAGLYAVFRAPVLTLPLSLFVLFLAEDGTARAVGPDLDSSMRAIGAFELVFALLTVAAAVWLDYHGLRRHAFWPHVLGALGIPVGVALLLGLSSYQLALVVSGAAFLVVGVWLGRLVFLAAGGLALWVGITALEPSPVVLTASGLGFIGLSLWLSLANSPIRRQLQNRTLPAPQRD